MEKVKLDEGLILKILERGNDVWIKRTKTGIVVLEAGFTKRQELPRAEEAASPPE